MAEAITGAMVLTAVTKIAVQLVQWIPAMRGARKQQRGKIGDYCEQIARALSVAYAEYLEGRIPHGACGELSGYFHGLGGVLRKSGVLDADDLKHLEKQFQTAYTVEQLGLKPARGKQQPKGKAYTELATASGLFLAAANKIRALN